MARTKPAPKRNSKAKAGTTDVAGKAKAVRKKIAGPAKTKTRKAAKPVVKSRKKKVVTAPKITTKKAVKTEQGPSRTEKEKEEEVYHVNTILSHKEVGGEKRYLLSWTGYSNADNTWETADHLSGCKDKLQAYTKASKTATTKPYPALVRDALRDLGAEGRHGASRMAIYNYCAAARAPDPLKRTLVLSALRKLEAQGYVTMKNKVSYKLTGKAYKPSKNPKPKPASAKQSKKRGRKAAAAAGSSKAAAAGSSKAAVAGEKRRGPGRPPKLQRKTTSTEVLGNSRLFLGNNLEIVKSDLSTYKHADAVVHPTDAALSTTGQVGSALLEKGGAKLQAELEKSRAKPYAVSECCITTGGGIPAQHIIHCNSPRYDSSNKATALEQLTATVGNILKIAEENELKSVALPSVGSGANGYPKDLAARTILKAIEEYFRGETETTIQKVHFVLYDDTSVEAYGRIYRTEFAETVQGDESGGEDELLKPTN